MQFAKFHGWVFIALGIVLITVQLAMLVIPKRDVRLPEAPAAVHQTTLTAPISGIIGGLSLLFGVGLFIANRNKPKE